jgi:uracil-DNA glycosylase family protein
MLLGDIPAALSTCRACDLWEHATQAVPGAGPPTARLMLVGEQPGDREDLEGAVFVGPAGRVLDDALVEAGIDRAGVYVTNAVKHFSWKPAPRGKRRLHQRPNRAETTACRPWLVAEAEALQPRLILCLGALAAESLISPDWRIAARRGEITPSEVGIDAMATYHPSAVLRATDQERRRLLFADLVADLRLADTTSRAG